MPSPIHLGAFTVAAMLSRSAMAGSLQISESQFPFIQPNESAGDSRGPCPALNALANHGLLPRDGKNIDMAMALEASAYLGMGATPVRVVFTGALKTSTTGNASTLNLHDFAQHWPQEVEYDGSISRVDHYFGDPAPYNQSVWERSQYYWTWDSDIITPQDAHNELSARTNLAKAYNKEYKELLGEVGARLNYGNLFWAFPPANGSALDGANRTHVKYLIEKERLPLELGWTPPQKLTSPVDLAKIIAKIDLQALAKSPANQGNASEV